MDRWGVGAVRVPFGRAGQSLAAGAGALNQGAGSSRTLEAVAAGASPSGPWEEADHRDAARGYRPSSGRTGSHSAGRESGTVSLALRRTWNAGFRSLRCGRIARSLLRTSCINRLSVSECSGGSAGWRASARLGVQPETSASVPAADDQMDDGEAPSSTDDVVRTVHGLGAAAPNGVAACGGHIPPHNAF